MHWVLAWLIVGLASSLGGLLLGMGRFPETIVAELLRRGWLWWQINLVGRALVLLLDTLFGPLSTFSYYLAYRKHLACPPEGCVCPICRGGAGRQLP